MAILRIRTPAGKEAVYRLPNREVRIGRSPACHIRLQNDRVSRNHAAIEPTPEGFLLTDLGSGNGTFVNGYPVTSHVLRHGDEVRVGNTRMRFYMQ